MRSNRCLPLAFAVTFALLTSNSVRALPVDADAIGAAGPASDIRLAAVAVRGPRGGAAIRGPRGGVAVGRVAE